MSDRNALSIGSTAPGHYGSATTGVMLAETTFATVWNIQGDPRRPAFAAAVRRLFDIALPTAPNTTMTSAALTAMWIGPESWLLVAGGVSPSATPAGRRDALNVAGSALFDLTASRVAWTVSGAHAATVLATNCPLDFHPRVFVEGACGQSVFGHVNALYYRSRAAPEIVVMVARSYARDVWRTLCTSAAQYGYDVLAPQPFQGDLHGGD